MAQISALWSNDTFWEFIVSRCDKSARTLVQHGETKRRKRITVPHGSQLWWPQKNYRRARITRMASAQMSMPIACNIIISECRRIYSILFRLSSVQYAPHPAMPRTTASAPFTSNGPRMAGTYQNRVILKCNGQLAGHKIKIRGALRRLRTLRSFLLHG